MSTAAPHPEDAAERDQFQRLLAKKRAAAEETSSYSSQDTRKTMFEEFKKRTGGKEPYKWQLDIAEALLLKIDCVAIAGTGAGKTMPFFMPLLVDGTGKKKVIIVSALNALQDDQARRFREYGLSATAVNSQTWSTELSRDIVADKYQVLLCGPEMMLEHAGFSKILRTSDFTDNVIAIVVDEAHCISQWGHQFRKHYGQLATLRSYVPLEIPFLATSATMTPSILTDVQLKLQISKENMFFVNLGNDRPNLTPIVAILRGSSDFDGLNFAVDEAQHKEDLLPTIIYVSTRDSARAIWEHLCAKVPESYRRQINFIHSRRTVRAKQWVMEQFQKGEIKILVATDVAGMGMDIPQIIRVVEYMVPDSLPELIQHLGRAGRAGQPAVVILLVEPSVFKRIKKRSKKNNTADHSQPVHLATKKRTFDDAIALDPGPAEDADDEAAQSDASSGSTASASDTDDEGARHNEVDKLDDSRFEYQKKVEAGLRDWIEAPRCRREVADRYFNNPQRQEPLVGPCCDLCIIRKFEDPSAAVTDADLEIFGLIGRLGIRDPWEPPLPAVIPAGPKKRKDGEGPRRKTRLQSCRDALRSWRRWRWNLSYKLCAWSFDALLSDKELEVLAKGAHIQTVDDIKVALPKWEFAELHGAEVLDRLRPFDEEWQKERLEQAEENKTQKRRITETKKQARDEARREEMRALRASRSNTNPVVQRSYTVQPVASGSGLPSMPTQPTYRGAPPSPYANAPVPAGMPGFAPSHGMHPVIPGHMPHTISPHPMHYSPYPMYTTQGHIPYVAVAVPPTTAGTTSKSEPAVAGPLPLPIPHAPAMYPSPTPMPHPPHAGQYYYVPYYTYSHPVGPMSWHPPMVKKSDE